MPDKQCANGHLIDEAWDLCPYCPPAKNDPGFMVVTPRPTLAAPAPSNVYPTVHPPPTSSPSAPASQAVASAVVAAADPPRTATMPKVGAPARRYVVGWLLGLNLSVRGESYPVRMGRNTIGRDRRSDIVIPDDLASGHHADLVFRPEEKRFILMDANSTNGTFVNENEIQPRADLEGKEVVRIGTHRYLFIPLCHEGFYWEDEGLLK